MDVSELDQNMSESVDNLSGIAARLYNNLLREKMDLETVREICVTYVHDFMELAKSIQPEERSNDDN